MILLLLISSLFTQQGEQWQQRQMGIWRVRVERGVSDESVDQIVSRLDAARRFYLEEWSFTFPRSVPVDVYATSTSFRRATTQRWYRAALWDGYVLHIQNPRLLRARNRLETTVMHEAAHVALQSRWGNTLPGWFEEGFAVYNSGELTGLPLPRKGIRSLREMGERRLRLSGDQAEREWYAAVGGLAYVFVRQYGKDTYKRLIAQKLGKSFEHTVEQILRKRFADFERDLLEEYNFRVRKRKLAY